MNIVGDEIKMHSARYWNRLLHLAQNNLLYDRIMNIWYYRWKHMITSPPIEITESSPDGLMHSVMIPNIKPSIKIPTYQKRSPLCTAFYNAEYYDILTVSNFLEYSKYDDISISIQQCECHIWDPNDSAFKLAKIAVDNEYGDYALITNPISFTKIKNIMNNTLISNTTTLIENDPNDHIISYNLSNCDVSEYPIHIDMTIMSHYYYGVLTQLRSQHIRLFEYYHLLNHRNYYKSLSISMHSSIDLLKCIIVGCCDRCNSGLCTVCGINENVFHFLFKCIRYKQERDIMMQTLSGILLNKYHLNINLKNSLFPPNNITIQHRKAILNSVVVYVLKTKRLFQDY